MKLLIFVNVDIFQVQTRALRLKSMQIRRMLKLLACKSWLKYNTLETFHHIFKDFYGFKFIFLIWGIPVEQEKCQRQSLMVHGLALWLLSYKVMQYLVLKLVVVFSTRINFRVSKFSYLFILSPIFSNPFKWEAELTKGKKNLFDRCNTYLARWIQTASFNRKISSTTHVLHVQRDDNGYETFVYKSNHMWLKWIHHTDFSNKRSVIKTVQVAYYFPRALEISFQLDCV